MSLRQLPPEADPQRLLQALNAMRAGDHSGCLAILEPLLATFGPVTSWVLLQVRAYASLQLYERALAILAQALAGQPRCGKYWEFAAGIWDAVGAWDAARACLQRSAGLGLVADEAPALLARLAQRPRGGKSMPKVWRRLLSRPALAPRVGACVIVGSDYELLPACLASLQGLDDVVVVGTLPQNRILETAGAHGARYGQFVWQHDFAAARNHALSLAVTDWVLMIDTDERLMAGGVQALRESIDALGGGRVMLSPVIVDEQDDQSQSSVHRQGRLFARKPDRRYVGAIHETLVDGDDLPLVACAVDGWRLQHLGYTHEAKSRYGKAARNRAPIEHWVDMQPDDPMGHFYLAKEMASANQWREAAAEFRRALDLQPPGQIGALALLGLLRALIEAGDIAEVRRLGEETAALGAAFPDFWLLLAEAHRRGGASDEARRCFERALHLPGDQASSSESAGARTWRPRLALAELAADGGDWPSAYDALSPAADELPGMGWPLLIRAALMTDRHAEANALADRLLTTVDPAPALRQAVIRWWEAADAAPTALDERISAWIKRFS